MKRIDESSPHSWYYYCHWFLNLIDDVLVVPDNAQDLAVFVKMVVFLYCLDVD
jgi:hypothetical protein